MSRCQHVYFFNLRTRCTADATHYLHDDDIKRVPGAWCLKHANEIINEYRDKLGWYWSMEPIEDEL